MKSLKNSNLPKLVAFFVAAIILTCTVAYATGGFTQLTNNNQQGDENNQEDDITNGESNDDANQEETPVIKPRPEYLHYITGCEITSEESHKKPICFTLDALAPQYGLSHSYLIYEIPTEFGKSRYIAYTDNALNLGKIGSIAPTRGYISNLASYFGGILVSNGNDTNVKTESFAIADGFLDITENIGYHYTEPNNYSYTNGDLITALIKNTKTGLIKIEPTTIPYYHNEYYADPIRGTTKAEYIQIKYSNLNYTEFLYSQDSHNYSLYKNGSVQKDLLNDKICTYDNVFILNVNSATYETLEYTECVLDTKSSGTGFFFTEGTYTQITWTVSNEGKLIFLNENGEKLTANRGTTYIALAKSSEPQNITIQ